MPTRSTSSASPSTSPKRAPARIPSSSPEPVPTHGGTPTSTTSPGPEPATTSSSAAKNEDGYDKLADALYQWCYDNGGIGTVFTQDIVLSSNIIPDRDPTILLGAVSHLVKHRLFKVHDVKGSTGVAWELVSEENAASYDDLSRDEQMVYSYIEGSGRNGIWVKTIVARTQLHIKNVEKCYRSLVNKGLIKKMTNVKNPNRKMFILSRLRPDQDATGGTWYTGEELDDQLLDNVGNAVEAWVSRRSWVQVDPPEPVTGQKRKTPSSRFDVKGKGKARAGSDADDEDEQPKHKKKSKPAFEPHPIDYLGYPTIHEITKAMNDQRVATTILPSNAMEQLVEVMVLDDKVVKLFRLPNPGNVMEEVEAEEADDGRIAMYRHLTPPDVLIKKMSKIAKAKKGNAQAQRELELEELGMGGSTEIPCLACPVFDICGDGGPINAKTCVYWDDFFSKMEEADAEAEARAKVHAIDQLEQADAKAEATGNVRNNDEMEVEIL